MAAIAASTIAQEAFRLLELQPIASFGDDSEQATAAAEQYPEALSIVLEHADWSCASRIATLAQSTEGAGLDADLPYSYVLPADCLMLREVLTDAAYRLDERVLRAEAAGGLTIRYTFLVTDETTMPATLRLAAALQLASLLAPRWLESRVKRADLLAQLQRVLARAGRTDARTASPRAFGPGGIGTDWVSEAIQ